MNFYKIDKIFENKRIPLSKKHEISKKTLAKMLPGKKVSQQDFFKKINNLNVNPNIIKMTREYSVEEWKISNTNKTVGYSFNVGHISSKNDKYFLI